MPLFNPAAVVGQRLAGAFVEFGHGAEIKAGKGFAGGEPGLVQQAGDAAIVAAGQLFTEQGMQVTTHTPAIMGCGLGQGFAVLRHCRKPQRFGQQDEIHGFISGGGHHDSTRHAVAASYEIKAS